MKKTSKPSTRVTHRVLATTAGVMLAAGLTVLTPSNSAGAVDDQLDTTRAALEKWVETRRLISHEKRDWAEDKAVLGSRIELVTREIESLRNKVTESRERIADTDRKRDELLQESDSLREATQSLAATIGTHESLLASLLPRLPEPIRNRVKVLSQRLPENPAESKATLSERFQTVVGILNEVDKFNRDITLELEVRELPDGTAVEVTSLYVGLGQAYYASANGAAAGTGCATNERWIWTASNAAAPAILEAIAIQKNERPASFVRLPLRVD